MTIRGIAALLSLGLLAPAYAEDPPRTLRTDALASQLEVGDVVFIRVDVGLFKKVASATNSWTNHVGIVTAVAGGEAQVSESAFPFSRATTLAKFVKRSENGRIEVRRLARPLTRAEQDKIVAAARSPTASTTTPASTCTRAANSARVTCAKSSRTARASRSEPSSASATCSPRTRTRA